eukprot:UN02152
MRSAHVMYYYAFSVASSNWLILENSYFACFECVVIVQETSRCRYMLDLMYV